MTHCNLVLTTISMVEDITGSQVGGTFYPSSSGHVFLAFVLEIFPAHLTRLIMNQELVMTNCYFTVEHGCCNKTCPAGRSIILDYGRSKRQGMFE